MKKTQLYLMSTAALLLVPATIFAASRAKPNPKDPQYQAKGDQHRTYIFPGTDKSIPYRLYVPMKWSKTEKLPLIIVFHGAGVSEDTPFMRGDGILPKMAEQRGYIVASVLGYVANGYYGSPFPMVAAPRPANAPPRAAPKAGTGKAGKAGKARRAPLPPATAEDKERSEQDVLNVEAIVSKEYNTDPKRTYLMGNSMGGDGVWYIGEKYPKMWAAISPSDGPVPPDEYPYDRLKGVPVMVVHGDHDTVNSFDASLKMVNLAKQHGIEVEWFPVKDGDHFSSWAQVLPQTFDFFDKHTKK